MPKKQATKNSTKEMPSVIEAPFKLKQIKWKFGSAAWEVAIEILSAMNESFINYDAKIVFNEEPFLKQIKDLESDIEAAKKDSKLFKESQQQEIDEIDEQIDEVKREMEELKKECKTIEFKATVLKFDMTGNWPSVTFAIASEVIAELNEAKTKVGNYKIILIPTKVC